MEEDTTALFALFHPLLLEGRCGSQMMDRGICAGSFHVLCPTFDTFPIIFFHISRDIDYIVPSIKTYTQCSCNSQGFKIARCTIFTRCLVFFPSTCPSDGLSDWWLTCGIGPGWISEAVGIVSERCNTPISGIPDEVWLAGVLGWTFSELFLPFRLGAYQKPQYVNTHKVVLPVDVPFSRSLSLFHSSLCNWSLFTGSRSMTGNILGDAISLPEWGIFFIRILIARCYPYRCYTFEKRAGWHREQY